MPARPDEIELHRRLTEGDETASRELCDRYLNWLTDVLSAKYRTLAERDDALPVHAASETLLNYAERPWLYDPEGMNLRRFLVMSASRDLLNEWKRLYGRDELHQSFEDLVELGIESRNRIDEGPEEQALLHIVAERYWDQVQRVLPQERDLLVFALMTLEERSTAVYAKVLGLPDLSPERQRTEVKRAKDRILKRVQRAFPADRTS